MNLEDCPFCGNNEYERSPHAYFPNVAVRCTICGCKGPEAECWEDAQILWNTRLLYSKHNPAISANIDKPWV